MNAPPARPLAGLQTFLAFDFGTRRTGVAYGSRMLDQPEPRGAIVAEGDARWPHITRHLLGLWNGQPGARRWRQVWSDHRLKALPVREVARRAHAARLAGPAAAAAA